MRFHSLKNTHKPANTLEQGFCSCCCCLEKQSTKVRDEDDDNDGLGLWAAFTKPNPQEHRKEFHNDNVVCVASLPPSRCVAVVCLRAVVAAAVSLTPTLFPPETPLPPIPYSHHGDCSSNDNTRINKHTHTQTHMNTHTYSNLDQYLFTCDIQPIYRLEFRRRKNIIRTPNISSLSAAQQKFVLSEEFSPAISNFHLSSCAYFKVYSMCQSIYVWAV